MDQKKFQKLVATISPSSFADYRLYLSELYKLVKADQKSYSYIKFTSQLGLGNCNALYLIIHKNRPLTVKAAKKIAQHLGLKDKEKKYFLKLVEYQGITDPGQRRKVFSEMLAIKSSCLSKQLTKQNLEFFSQWYHSAIYELLGFPHSSHDPKWIGKQLKPHVPPGKVAESLKLLENLGLIQYDDALGRLNPTEEVISTGAEIRGIVFKTYHNQMIELGQRALSMERGSNRDISAVTISVSQDKMNEIKKLTGQFRKDLLALAEQQDCDKEQILQVNIQVFPLTEAQKKS